MLPGTVSSFLCEELDFKVCLYISETPYVYFRYNTNNGLAESLYFCSTKKTKINPSMEHHSKNVKVFQLFKVKFTLFVVVLIVYTDNSFELNLTGQN